MRKTVRILIYTGIYIFCIIAFFGIANGLGWDIEPSPQIIGCFAALYLGALLPLWKSGGDSQYDKNQIVDWDTEMERRKKMRKPRKKKTKQK